MSHSQRQIYSPMLAEQPQREAAEALMILKNSSKPPIATISPSCITTRNSTVQKPLAVAQTSVKSSKNGTVSLPPVFYLSGSQNGPLHASIPTLIQENQPEAPRNPPSYVAPITVSVNESSQPSVLTSKFSGILLPNMPDAEIIASIRNVSEPHRLLSSCVNNGKSVFKGTLLERHSDSPADRLQQNQIPRILSGIKTYEERMLSSNLQPTIISELSGLSKSETVLNHLDTSDKHIQDTGYTVNPSSIQPHSHHEMSERLHSSSGNLNINLSQPITLGYTKESLQIPLQAVSNKMEAQIPSTQEYTLVKLTDGQVGICGLSNLVTATVLQAPTKSLSSGSLKLLNNPSSFSGACCLTTVPSTHSINKSSSLSSVPRNVCLLSSDASFRENLRPLNSATPSAVHQSPNELSLKVVPQSGHLGIQNNVSNPAKQFPLFSISAFPLPQNQNCLLPADQFPQFRNAAVPAPQGNISVAPVGQSSQVKLSCISFAQNSIPIPIPVTSSFRMPAVPNGRGSTSVAPLSQSTHFRFSSISVTQGSSSVTSVGQPSHFKDSCSAFLQQTAPVPLQSFRVPAICIAQNNTALVPSSQTPQLKFSIIPVTQCSTSVTSTNHTHSPHFPVPGIPVQQGGSSVNPAFHLPQHKLSVIPIVQDKHFTVPGISAPQGNIQPPHFRVSDMHVPQRNTSATAANHLEQSRRSGVCSQQKKSSYIPVSRLQQFRVSSAHDPNDRTCLTAENNSPQFGSSATCIPQASNSVTSKSQSTLFKVTGVPITQGSLPIISSNQAAQLRCSALHFPHGTLSVNPVSQASQIKTSAIHITEDTTACIASHSPQLNESALHILHIKTQSPKFGVEENQQHSNTYFHSGCLSPHFSNTESPASCSSSTSTQSGSKQSLLM
ncbi:mucin-17-like [Protopterus annectens]|uniref:mucin-17-like n=1 Tax=Protopterus annectens TaxID=7888 RepID=UPI001CFC2027|nr:mucin-17-like [Protopterus annectens]